MAVTGLQIPNQEVLREPLRASLGSASSLSETSELIQFPSPDAHTIGRPVV